MAALARIENEVLPAPAREQALQRLVGLIKDEGRGKDYDCIIGVSGGADSTSVAFYVKELGLRPLAVHFDNGWDSELAVDNIKRTLGFLKIELLTHVVDWEEFKDLQLCFLKSSVPNCETPTDHGITALLFHTAHKYKTRFILSGSNIVTEAIMPLSWGHYNQDLRHLLALHRRFGRVPLRTMPTISLAQYLYFVFAKKMRQIPLLNYYEYNKSRLKELLTQRIGWRDYGGKHCESVWTRFFQSYYLPKKFGFDKRKAHLSSLICSGQMTRDQALRELKEPIYDPALLEQDLQFVLKKFDLSREEFDHFIQSPPKEARDYPSYYYIFEKMKKYKNIFRKIATRP